MKGTALLGCDAFRLVEACQHSGETYCSIIRDGEVSKQQVLCLIDIFFDAEDGGSTLHSVTFQMALLFIVPEVRTSDLTSLYIVEVLCLEA
jgi:hypothetical protein